MILNLGDFATGETVYIPFHTFDSNDPSASVTITGLLATDIEVYKDGSVTQRSSDNGYTLLDTDGIDFDGTTGLHGISIDLSDNSDAGFYAAGSSYWVAIASITVDGATINFWAAVFTIERTGGTATILTDTEAVLTDSEAILTDSEAIIADTEAAVPVLTDTEAILADSEAIVADTNELQTDWTDGGRLDLIIDAVLADTEAVLTDSEAVLTDTEAAITERSTLLTDTEAVLTDTEAAITERSTLLTDTEAVLADTEAAITERSTLLTDTEAILTDTEAVLTDTEATQTSAEQALRATGIVLHKAAIESVTSQTAFVIPATDDATDDNAYARATVVFIDQADANQVSTRRCISYTASSRTVTINAAPAFTVAAGDTLAILSTSVGALQPTLVNRRLDVTATGAAGIDWSNVENAGSTVNLADTTVNLVNTTTANTDVPAVLADTEAVLADTEASQTTEGSILTDTEAAITERSTLLTDTEAVLTDSEAIKTETDKIDAAHTEPAGVPAANETPLDKLGYLYMALRNQVDVTATKKQFYDDGGAIEWEKDLSDDGTTYSETEGNAP